MRNPNFFIIGAPKCGTTSLATWLGEHPRIFMSPLKEPHFFNTDLRFRHVWTWEDYRRLFRKAGPQHLAIGEASVFYLFSEEAVPRIERELPGSRYIVMIRNLVEMAYALHEQYLFSGDEHIRDFREAWALSPERREGRNVSRWCREPRILDYQRVCRLGEQLERLLQTVPRERVLVLLLDDVRGNPRREYLKVLEFLGVPDDGRTAFPRYNPAKEPRSWLLHRVRVTLSYLRQRLGLRPTGLLAPIRKLERRYRPRPPLPEDLREALQSYFLEDIQKLERLLNRDLSHWLVKSGPAQP